MSLSPVLTTVKYSVLTVLLLSLIEAPVLVAQRMPDGENGAAGDPGSNGKNGQDGFRLGGGYLTDGSEIPFSLFAPSAGNGGKGGDGIDGDDPDTDAIAGDGGDGGNGGRIAITGIPGTLRRHLYNWGSGDGGNGGRGGKSAGEVANGQGGNAGRGGNIYLNLSSSELFISRVTSGDGGNAWGDASAPGSTEHPVAGSGGSIDAKYKLEATGTFSDYGFVHELTAGNAGTGFDFASGGQGGHVTFRTDRIFVNPRNEAFRTQWDLMAGHGGSSYGSAAGAGGTAKLLMNDVVVGRGAAPDVVRSFRMNLTGGDGGSAFSQRGDTGTASTGGHAILQANEGTSIKTFGAPSTRVVTHLIGGKGGDGHSTADASHGGSAIMKNLSIDTRHSAPVSSSVYFEAVLIGGDGGASQNGNGGNGGNAHYSGHASKIWGNDEVESIITAQGGQGGSAPGSSHGGNASIRMNNTFVQIDGAPTTTRLTHQAVGGNALRGNGGNATVETRNISQHDLLIDSRALSGYGHGGRSGSATAISQAETIATSGEFATTALSHAEVGLLKQVNERETGLAYSEATAISAGGSMTTADATAIGGHALYGGHGATARAHVQAGGQQVAEAKAHSVSQIALNIDRRRASFAEATVVAPQSEARGTSLAEADGDSSEAHSYSSVTAATAIASSTAHLGWGVPHRKALLSTQTQQLNVGTAGDSISVYAGLERDQFFNDIDYATPTRTFATILGGNESLVNIETTELATELDFDSATSITMIAGDYNLGAGETAAQVESNFNYFENVWPVDSQQHLHAFFYDFEEINGGFEEFSIQLEVLGTTYLDDTFSDSAAAMMALESLNIDVGLRGTSPLVSYSLAVSSSHQENQSFDFRFGFGAYSSSTGSMSLSNPQTFSAVPEPSSFTALLALVGLGCLNYRIRRRTEI